MQQKHSGLALIVLVIILGIAMLLFLENIYSHQYEMGCLPSKECKEVESILNWTHIFIGILSALFALGLYMVLFSKGEESILKRLEEDSHQKIREEKFSILLKGLNKFERQTLTAVREQPGITQQTLRFRTDLSKAKLSQVLQELEKKKLIFREKEKKTFKIYLVEEFEV